MLFVSSLQPVISTNWSGITAFLDSEVGYPLRIDGLETVTEESWFKGFSWARPSVQHLMELMRHVFDNREEAAEKGRKARLRQLQNYAPDVLARRIVAEFQRVNQKVSSRGEGGFASAIIKVLDGGR